MYQILECFVRFPEVVNVAVFVERQRQEHDEQADHHFDGKAQEEDVDLRSNAVDDSEEEIGEQQRDHRGRGQLNADREHFAAQFSNRCCERRPSGSKMREPGGRNDFEAVHQRFEKGDVCADQQKQHDRKLQFELT